MLRVLMVLVSLLFITLSVRAAAEDGAPLTIAGARQYDIASRIKGQVHRLMVGPPEKTDPAVTYPVFYVLDGNENFGTAIGMARTARMLPRAAGHRGRHWLSYRRSRRDKPAPRV